MHAIFGDVQPCGSEVFAAMVENAFEQLDRCCESCTLGCRLLEGDTVHLSFPKNFCGKDIEVTKDTPIFATADAPLVLSKTSNSK